MPPEPDACRVIAVLGPTNTGKTWHAIDRMLDHVTGMIGLPLRLLAREVYERVCRAQGSQSVALVTGEERMIPKQTRYWVCTVEAMPQSVGVDFLAVDEIQLCGDPERGHVFTQRLLSARGQRETMFLGADTMRPLIGQLIPEARFKRRTRLSQLSYVGSRKLSRIKARTAVVAFSVEEVYAIAETLRSRRGGAAVVLGALSPRTRNAQVELYQNGDVEVLVATDAIGMGLNLDIDHVGFAELAKFDGRRVRQLHPYEIGQIAGRAGRYRTNGTFGVTAGAEPFDSVLASAVETSRFRPLKCLQWRNDRLSFQSTETLIESLHKPSDTPLLTLARDADDALALQMMSDMPEIRRRLGNSDDVRLLWDICQIPDFRKLSRHYHCELLVKLFFFLQETGCIPDDWLEHQVRRIDRIDGDLESLSRRVAFVRTWTYLSQKSNWIVDSDYWRERTRSVEDRISDALHEGLTRRFVDRRISVLMRNMKEKEDFLAEISEQGQLTVEGEKIGRIEGFRFLPAATTTIDEAKTLRQAATHSLVQELSKRALRFTNAPNNEIGLTDQGGLMWGDIAVGKLVAGGDLYSPEIEVFVDDEAGQQAKQQVARRLRAYIDHKISTHCEALLNLRKDETIIGLARGIAYRIHESFGVLARTEIATDLKALAQDDRKLLRAHGVRFGQHTIFIHSALKPESTRIRLLLWALREKIADVPTPPPAGHVTIPTEDHLAKDYYLVAGYFPAGARALRIDMLDRLSNLLREKDSRCGFEADADMLSLTGLSAAGFADLMKGLGYQVECGRREKKRMVPTRQDPSSPLDPQNGNSSQQFENDPSAQVTSDSTVQPRDAQQPGRVTAATTDHRDEKTAVVPEVEYEDWFRFFWKVKPKSSNRKFETRPGQRATGQSDRGRRHKRKGSGQDKPSKQRKLREPAPLDPDSPFAILARLKESTDP